MKPVSFTEKLLYIEKKLGVDRWEQLRIKRDDPKLYESLFEDAEVEIEAVAAEEENMKYYPMGGIRREWK